MTAPLAPLLAALLLGAPPAAPEPLEPRHLFDIATTGGAVESTWSPLAYDREHQELFAVFGGQVHVFNAAGMETFAFGGDGDLGLVERVAPLEGGDLLLLTREDGRRAIVRCDYRGERIAALPLRGLPPTFAGFDPDRLLARGGKLYLVEAGSMRVAVADLDGRVERTVDLAALLREADPSLRGGLSGFTVDGQGNLIFTMPLSFTAFVLSPARKLRQFGSRGSVPGKFNVVGAVEADEEGHLFVLDRLRSVVMVFDPSLRFLQEFGYRGDGPASLVAPFDVAVGNGRVHVSQARQRGVKVFLYRDPAPAPGAVGGPPRDPAGGPADGGARGEGAGG